MTLQEIQNYLKEHCVLVFEYKSVYYSLQKKGCLFRPIYSLTDTDNPPQKRNSLEALFTQICLHDGVYLREIKNQIKVPNWNDPSWLSYEAIRHDVVVYNQEIHFLYNEKYYWIAHSNNGISHFSDAFGNTQEFNSPRDLFEHARIDNKSLKDIWSQVVVAAC